MRDDNLYVFVSGAAPLGLLAGVPLTLSGGFGYEEGALAAAPSKNDWSLGVAAELAGFELGATYVDTDIDDSAGRLRRDFGRAHVLTPFERPFSCCVLPCFSA